MNQLVTTDWLNKNIEKVKILDASWHLPNANRNSFEEYKTNHVLKSIFFDIDNYNLIGWQTLDIYQNLSITFLSSIEKIY